MTPLPAPAQEAIAAWFATGEIDLFIGYAASDVPLRAAPIVIRRADEVGRLIWDATCEANLTGLLKGFRGQKVGLMVKGCDARAITGLIQERQWSRERLRLMGAPCTGVVSPLRVAAHLGIAPDALEDGALSERGVIAHGECIPWAEALHSMCLVCDRRNPNNYDLLLGEPVAQEAVAEPFAHVRAHEALDTDARWAHFVAEVARCNLCYACRNACPLCYCTTCFVDRTQPSWFTATSAPADAQFYQVMRTFHLAGRCVGCGACTRACPMGVDLRLFLDKLRADALELFGYEAGLDPAAKPPLTTYREDDPNEFVL